MFSMTAGQLQDGLGENQQFLMPGDMNAGLYDSTSSESSASSPLNSNGFEKMYPGNGYMGYTAYPMQYPANGIPMGMIPVELDIEGLYEDHDRRRRKNGSEKIVSSHVHSRRRAQNRASQRAFRDRKEKHMRELEQRLGELEGRHNDLTRSYESLQQEYMTVKGELDRLRNESKEQDTVERSATPSAQTYQPSHSFNDPLLFDVSAFCFDQEENLNSGQ